MAAPSKSHLGRVVRSVQKLEDSPERTVKEVTGACRSVARALAEHQPVLLPEFKLGLHAFLGQWIKRLAPTEPDTPRLSHSPSEANREDLT